MKVGDRVLVRPESSGPWYQNVLATVVEVTSWSGVKLLFDHPVGTRSPTDKNPTDWSQKQVRLLSPLEELADQAE